MAAIMKNIFRILAFSSGCLISLGTSATLLSQYQSTGLIVAYFSPIQFGNEYSPTPLTTGYYRVIKQKNSHGQYLVQDFYIENRHKQSDPFWLDNAQDLHSFDPISIKGKIKLYYPTGEVFFTTQYNAKHQLIGTSQLYNRQGKVLSKDVVYADGSTQSDYWYSPNVPALKVKFDKNWHVLHAQGWDTHGQAIPENECFAEKSLEPQNQLDPCYLLMNLLNNRNQTLTEEEP